MIGIQQEVEVTVFYFSGKLRLCPKSPSLDVAGYKIDTYQFCSKSVYWILQKFCLSIIQDWVKVIYEKLDYWLRCPLR